MTYETYEQQLGGLLSYHLQNNVCPPLPGAYDTALEAINNCNNGDYDAHACTMPDGEEISAGQFVDDLHLAWLLY